MGMIWHMITDDAGIDEKNLKSNEEIEMVEIVSKPTDFSPVMTEATQILPNKNEEKGFTKGINMSAIKITRTITSFKVQPAKQLRKCKSSIEC